MANTFLTISMITREALRVLENLLTFTKHVNRNYDDQFGKIGAKIGNVVNVRKPPRYVVRTGQSVSLQDITETQVPVTLNVQAGVDISYNSQDKLLSIDDFSQRILYPQIAAIANQIDRDGLQLFLDVYNAVGTRGTVPSTLLTYLQAGQKLDEEGCPTKDRLRCMVINPEMRATIVNALTGLFHDSAEVSRQYKEGTMGRSAGFKWEMDQNVHSHTAGTFTTGSTPLVNGASQTGNSLVTDGWANSTAILLRGDIITLASVNAVNPQNRQDTGSLRNFVVTEDVTSDGSGNATIPIEPAISPAANDPFRTVTQSPANNAAITPAGTEDAASPQGVAFHRDAFCLATADLPLPEGVHEAARVSDKQLGISIRMVQDYDIREDLFICRTDVLYGWATLYPELACRVHS